MIKKTDEKNNMNTLDCDIIRDLIPLYVDGLCSDQSKACVEEHIAACEECQKAVEICQKNIFSVKSAEKQELHAMKKVHRKLRNQKMLLTVFFCIMLLLGLCLFIGEYNSSFREWQHYVLLGLALFIFEVLSFRKKDLKNPVKKDRLTACISLVPSLLFAVYFLFFLNPGTEYLYKSAGIPAYVIGPFLDVLQFACFILQLICLSYSLKRIYKDQVDSGIGCILALSGIFLQLALNTFLFHMSSPDALVGSIQNAIFWIALLCVIACTVHLFLHRKH